jgi:hypothetical protein
MELGGWISSTLISFMLRDAFPSNDEEAGEVILVFIDELGNSLQLGVFESSNLIPVLCS